MKLLLHSLRIILSIALFAGFLASCASHPDEDQIKGISRKQKQLPYRLNRP